MIRLALLSLLCGAALGCKSSGPAPAATTPAPTDPAPADPAPPQPTEGEATFTGTIVEIDFGCRADASCDVILDGNRKVHFGHDTRRHGPTVWGDFSMLGSLADAPDKGAGRKVEVFAAVTGEGTYTLEGKRDYYIRVVP